MVYDDVFEEGHVEYELEQKHGVEFAPVPFNDGHGQTTYWISRDGLHAYVGISFGGWVKLKDIRIYPAKYRTSNSVPFFKRRRPNGVQSNVTVPNAVFGAFILKDELPQIKISFRDGNPNNCNLKNLEIAYDSKMVQNLITFKDLYRNHPKVTGIIESQISGISHEEAEDIVSESFLRMCMGCRTKIRNAMGLWIFKAKQSAISSKQRERLEFGLPNFTDIALTYQRESNFECPTFLTSELSKIAKLLLEGYNQKEIGKKLNLCQSAINLRVNKIREIYRKNTF